MEENWIGKAVSIMCDNNLGVFQGFINSITPNEITIVRVFRNGVPLRKQDAQVTLRSVDIIKISFIPLGGDEVQMTPEAARSLEQFKNETDFQPDEEMPSCSTAVTHPKQLSAEDLKLNQELLSLNIDDPLSSEEHLNEFREAAALLCTNTSVAQLFRNMVPPKVEVRYGAAFVPKPLNLIGTNNGEALESVSGAAATDVDAPGSSGLIYGDNSASAFVSNNSGTRGRNGNGNNLKMNDNGNSRKQMRKQLRHENNLKQHQTFGTSVDDPILDEDFDFEGNLALFDKQAIWNNIEAEQKPDLVRQAVCAQQPKYRHDENVLTSQPTQFRQIKTVFENTSEFVTDEGLVIPTIPSYVRSAIEFSSDKAGLTMQRQADILARGATDLAILLLGGARRLTPNNCHQWPTITIICDRAGNLWPNELGAATGRQLASHGLKVVLYLEEAENMQKNSNELELFKATGNKIAYTVKNLPTPDLIILSMGLNKLSAEVKKWLGDNRASVLAVDPPPEGIKEVTIKCSILPILPLNGTTSTTCGKLYLCNVGIPERFYRDAGITYKSPFGHKFVIPIHSKV